MFSFWEINTENILFHRIQLVFYCVYISSKFERILNRSFCGTYFQNYRKTSESLCLHIGNVEKSISDDVNDAVRFHLSHPMTFECPSLFLSNLTIFE